jgi:putative DNA primase/helicase
LASFATIWIGGIVCRGEHKSERCKLPEGKGVTGFMAITKVPNNYICKVEQYGASLRFVTGRAGRPVDFLSEIQEDEGTGMSRKGPRKSRAKNRGLVTAPLADFPPLETEWLWPGHIALESLTLLMGDPDVGKSYVALDLAARVSRGAEWPDGQSSEGAADVLLLSAEDHLFRMIRPALSAAQANLSRITFPYLTREGNAAEKVDRPINFKRDVNLLSYALEAKPECKLVIVDPFSAFLGNGAGRRNADVLSVLRTLHGLAVQYHVAVLLVTHLRKGGGPAIHRAVGGLGVTTMARAIWMVVRGKWEVGDRKSEVRVRQDYAGEACHGERRLLLPVKNNLARERTGLAFSLTKAEGEIAPRVEWSTEEVETTADEALAVAREARGPAGELAEEAEEFLRRTLANGPRLANEIAAEAWRVHRIRNGTLKRARKSLKTKAFRKQIPGPWWLQLPEAEPMAPTSGKLLAPLRPLGPVAENTEDFEGFQDDARGALSALEEGRIGGQKSEVGSQKSEVRGREEDCRCGEVEVR